MSEVLRKALGDVPIEPHVDDVTLAAYLDGALEDAARTEVESHVARCPQCADDIAAAARVEIEADATDLVDRAHATREAARATPSQASARRGSSSRSWMRIAAAIALLAGAGFVGREASQMVAGRLEPTLVAQLEEWTGRGVSTEGLSFTLAGGPGIELSGLDIGDDPRFSDQSFLDARKVALHVHPTTLLEGKLEGSVDIEGPHLRLVRNRVGHWNIETLGGASAGGPSRPGVVTEEIERALADAAEGIGPAGIAEEARVELASASIQDGTLEIADLGRGGAAFRVRNVDLSYHGVPGQRASVSLEGQVGSSDDRIALRGEIGPFAGNVTPVYRLREVELEAVPVSEIPGSPRVVEGQLTFDGHLESAGRALVDVVAAARGAGEMELCCGTFEGRNLAHDFVTRLASLPGGEQVLAAVRGHAALASVLSAPETTYDRLAGIADLQPGTLHLAGLEVDTTLFRADADASVGLEGHLAAEGDLLLSPELGAAVLAAAPGLSALSAPDGTLELPFRATGSWENLQLELDVQRLLARVEQARPSTWLDWLASLFRPRSARIG